MRFFGKRKVALTFEDKKQILAEVLERVKAGHDMLGIEQLAGPDIDKASISGFINEIASYGLPDKEKGKQSFGHWWEYDASQQDRVDAIERATAWITSR